MEVQVGVWNSPRKRGGNPSKAASQLRDGQKGVVLTNTPGGKQSVTTINASGLYRLVLRSDKPQAERFQIWVEDEVSDTLP